MSCKYNNCKICGYKSECEIFKENAELKKELEEADNATDCFNKQEEIIAKAKELLEDFICYANLADCNLYIKEQAEQFLRVEK